MGHGPATRQRLERERAFQDELYATGRRKRLDKYLRVKQAPSVFNERLGEGPGLALDYGCGKGSLTASLEERGYDAVGIDLSPEAIRQASENHELDFRVMNAESLEFPDGTFDLVCGRAILHHLDLDAAYREVSRVLKSDGKAVFLEPLGHNPLINLYRRMTPSMRTEDERPLRLRDIQKAERYFGDLRATFWDLFTLAAVPFRSQRLLEGLAALDAFVLRRSRLQRFAWNTVLELRQPSESRQRSG